MTISGSQDQSSRPCYRQKEEGRGKGKNILEALLKSSHLYLIGHSYMPGKLGDIAGSTNHTSAIKNLLLKIGRGGDVDG